MSIDKRTHEPRRSIITSGTFASVPQGFEGAKGSLRHVLKPEFQVLPGAGDARRAVLAVPRGHALLDLAAVDLGDLDATELARDCEILAKAIRENVEDLRRIVAAFGPHGTAEHQAEALELAERLGLTENAAAQAGGGLIGVVVLVGDCIEPLDRVLRAADGRPEIREEKKIDAKLEAKIEAHARRGSSRRSSSPRSTHRGIRVSATPFGGAG